MTTVRSTRERLVHLIQAMPGIHLRMAQRALQRSIGTIVYHVRALVQDGRIRRVRQGRYVRLYPVIPLPHGVSRHLAQTFWRLSVPSQRILHLLGEGPRRLVEVARRLGMSKQLAHYHLRRMLDKGAVEVRQDGHVKFYILSRGAEPAPSAPRSERAGVPPGLSYRVV